MPWCEDGLRERSHRMAQFGVLIHAVDAAHEAQMQSPSPEREMLGMHVIARHPESMQPMLDAVDHADRPAEEHVR